MFAKFAGTLAAGGLLVLLLMGASAGSLGRYQIVARGEGASPGAGSSAGPAVYRVDTATGQVCMFAFEGQWLEMGCVGSK